MTAVEKLQVGIRKRLHADAQPPYGRLAVQFRKVGQRKMFGVGLEGNFFQSRQVKGSVQFFQQSGVERNGQQRRRSAADIQGGNCRFL